MPAVVVLVTNADKVIFTHASGRRDVAAGATLSQDAIFRIASMGKPMTSAAIMMLQESGRLGLDDPAGRYVPGHRCLTGGHPSQSRWIARIETAAPPYYHPRTCSRTPLESATRFRIRSSSSSSKRVKASRIFRLLHDPGDKWTYGASTKYLGDIVERVSGQPLDSFLRTRFIEPLGMADTSFEVAAGARSRLVTLHQRVDGKLTERPNPDVAEKSRTGRWRPVLDGPGLRSVSAHVPERRIGRLHSSSHRSVHS